MPPTERATRRQLLLATGLFALAAAVFYGPHIVEGGFSIDDWGHAASAAYFRDDILSSYWAFTSNRPILVLYVPVTFIVFGAHEWVHLAWSTLLAVGLSTALFALLRRLDVPALHAAAIGLLVLLFPWSDSVRFWATAGHISLAIALGLAGVVVALRGLEARGAGRLGGERALHAGAVALYTASTLTYEIAGVALLLAGALYFGHAPRRVAALRWLVDAVIILACLAWSGIRGDRAQPSLEQVLEHTEQLADGGVTLLAQAALPFGTVGRWTVAATIVAIVAAATLVWGLGRDDAPLNAALRRWLTVFWAGLAVMAAGWALYVFADPYYQVLNPGVGNRTNGMAAVGVVLVVYSVVALAATLLTRWMGRSAMAASVASAIFALLLVADYGGDIRADQREWAHADSESDRMLANTKTALPDPPPESTVYTFGYPGSRAANIVVFAFLWDLNGAIKLTYGDPTLSGYPIIEGSTMRCTPKGVEPVGDGWTSAQGESYGQAFFVDPARIRAWRIDSRPECRKALAYFRPGPLLTPL